MRTSAAPLLVCQLRGEPPQAVELRRGIQVRILHRVAPAGVFDSDRVAAVIGGPARRLGIFGLQCKKMSVLYTPLQFRSIGRSQLRAVHYYRFAETRKVRQAAFRTDLDAHDGLIKPPSPQLRSTPQSPPGAQRSTCHKDARH